MRVLHAMCVCMGGVCAPYGISVEVADDVIDLPGWYGWCGCCGRGK